MEWFIVIAVIAAVFWYDSMRAREAALAASRDACLREGLQLLDDTVMQASMSIARDSRGRLALRRVYVFEFSDTGDNRRHGSVVLMRGTAGAIELEPYRMQ